MGISGVPSFWNPNSTALAGVQASAMHPPVHTRCGLASTLHRHSSELWMLKQQCLLSRSTACCPAALPVEQQQVHNRPSMQVAGKTSKMHQLTLQRCPCINLAHNHTQVATACLHSKVEHRGFLCPWTGDVEDQGCGISLCRQTAF